MKYSVLGFNQSKIMETDLKLTDLLILNYILQACGSPKMKHILDGDEHPLVWVQHKKISEDLPILRLSEGAFRNKLTELKQGGYIVSKTIAADDLRGTRTYYGVTETTMSLIYDVETSTSQKDDMVSGACHKNMTSDNLLKDNNKLNNTISKDIVANASPEESSSNTLSDYEQHMFSDDVKKGRKIIQQEDTEKKPRKKPKNKWDQCVDAINEYTQDEEFRTLLLDYLVMRLQMKDKPMYANQWKGMLNSLDRMGGDRMQIVRRSLENGWAGFFEIKRDRSKFGEHAGMSSKKVSKEEREEIMRNGQVF